VQGVAVVVDGIQRLQRGADVIEADLLRVQGAAGGLDVVLQLLSLGTAPVQVPDRLRPDPAGHPANHGIFSINAIGEEERQVRAELIDIHTPVAVVLHVGEGIAQGQR